MSNAMKTLTNGILKENPTFVLVLGMCPTLATTTSAINGMSMGLATMFVLICSNIVISLLKNLIPDKVRIPAFIVVIATFVTLVQLLMQPVPPRPIRRNKNGEPGSSTPPCILLPAVLRRSRGFA